MFIFLLPRCSILIRHTDTLRSLGLFTLESGDPMSSVLPYFANDMFQCSKYFFTFRIYGIHVKIMKMISVSTKCIQRHYFLPSCCRPEDLQELVNRVSTVCIEYNILVYVNSDKTKMLLANGMRFTIQTTSRTLEH